jgi:hypothetical protein
VEAVPLAPHLGRHRRFAYVVHGLVRRVGAHVDELFDLRGRAEPGELGPIELHFFFPDELIEVEPGAESTHREAVRLGDFVDVIGRDHRSCAGHVLYDHVGIAGNVFSQIAGDHARPCIIDATGAVAGDDTDRFVLKKRRLSERINNGNKHESES